MDTKEYIDTITALFEVKNLLYDKLGMFNPVIDDTVKAINAELSRLLSMPIKSINP